MKYKDRLERLGAMAATLPFHVEDMEAITRIFARWTIHRSDDDLKTIEVWLYCFTQRYVLLRLMSESNVAPSEVEHHIEHVFVRARDGMDQVLDSERFTHWVRVVCRNTFLNDRRSRVPFRSIDETPLPDTGESPQEHLEAELDRTVIYGTVERAIARLPDSLQRIARMRLLESRSYEHIAAHTDRPLPTVRTYVAKALRRLRRDPNVRALMEPFEPTRKEPPPLDKPLAAEAKRSNR